MELDPLLNLQLKSKFQTIRPSSESQQIPLYLSVTAREKLLVNKKHSLDLVLIIDNSGSMGGKKIKLVKQTIQHILQELTENDKFGLIVFNQVSEVLLPFSKMTPENKEKARKSIKYIETGGGTNLRDPLRQAMEMLQQREQVNEVSAVFFMSDGQDTCNNKQEDILNVLSSGDSNQKTGDFEIHTFGYGEDHDDKILAEISKARHGSFYYVKSVEMISSCFLSCF